jgi:hypothetical protein
MPTNTLSDMKSLIRLIELALRYWWVMVALIILSLLIGCRTYVPVENVVTEVVKELEIQRDSVFVHDSVFVRQANDTIYLTRWRVEYREALRVDTLHIVERDSINHIIEVEKKLTKMQELKMDIGAGVMWAVPIVLILYIVYRKLKN